MAVMGGPVIATRHRELGNLAVGDMCPVLFLRSHGTQLIDVSGDNHASARRGVISAILSQQ